MKLRFFNKTIEHRSFRYTPMYYDEQKEYIEMKKAQHRDVSKEDIDIETRKEILKHELSASWSRQQHATQAKRSANIRVLLLIAAIVILGYFLLYGLDDVDVVVEKMWK